MKKFFLAIVCSIFVFSYASAQIFTSNIEARNQEQCIEKAKQLENREAVANLKEKASTGKTGFASITYANPCEAIEKFELLSGTKYFQTEVTIFQNQPITIYQIYVEN